MRFHEAVGHALFDQGVATVFGLIGDANLYMMDSFQRCAGGRFVSVAHEAAAVLGANGYAQVADTVGVACVTHGPGLTNTLTALIECVKAHTPVVLIAGDTEAIDRDGLQNVPQEALVLPTGAGFEQVRSPATVATDMATALRRAVLERRPVVLNVPKEFQWCEVDYRPLPAQPIVGRAFGPDQAALDVAVGVIASARRPIVLAGRGAITPTARSALLRLSERIGASLATTLRAKDLFAGHPANLGIFGTLSGENALQVIGRSDCLLAFGAGLNARTTADRAMLTSKSVVHVDLDARAIDTSWPRTVGVVGDSSVVATAILDMLDQAGASAPGLPSPLPQQAATRSRVDSEGTPGVVDLRTALERIDEAFPSQRTLVIDGGRFVMHAYTQLHVPSPRHYVHSLHSGSIGLGMANAIGAAIAEPDRPVMVVTGDGGFMLGGLAEFNTAVRHGLDVVVVVLNDGAYGAEHIQFRNRGMDPRLSTFKWPEFAAVATALGGRGYTVRTQAELDAALAAVPHRDRPILIDVRLDPDAISRLQ